MLHHFRGGGPYFGAGPIFGTGRGRARRGDVRVALLMLLDEEPRNGYQLMHGDAAAPWECEDDPADDLHREIKKLIGQVAVAAMQVAQAGDRRQQKRAAATLADSRRSLYRILAEEEDA